MTTMSHAQSPNNSKCLAQAIDRKVSHDIPPKHTLHQELTRWADNLGKQFNQVKR